MDRGFRRCNRPNLQTGAVAKKGVIGGIGRSRAPYAGGGSWRGWRTGGPVGRASGWGWRARSVRQSWPAVGQEVGAGGRAGSRSGRPDRVDKCRVPETAKRPGNSRTASDGCLISAAATSASAAIAAGFPPAASVSAGFLPAAVTAASTVTATVVGSGAAAAAIAGGATPRRRTCRAGRRGG